MNISISLYSRFLQFILILFPLVYLTHLVTAQQINLPVWDQWIQVDLMEKLFSGSLTLTDLWQQHNESRMPIPRAIILGMAFISHWNMSLELVLNLILGVLCFAVISYQITITLRQMHSDVHPWMLPSLSVLIFSLAQWENWVWGFSINGYLGNLSALIVLMLLSKPKPSRGEFFVALVFWTINVLSTPAGFVLWCVGGLILAISGYTYKDTRKLFTIWLVFGITLAHFYFRDYIPYKIPGGLDENARAQPIAYIHYLLNYLGNPLFHSKLYNQYAWLGGLMGLIAFCYLPWSLIHSKRVNLFQLTPYLGIGMYVLGVGVLATYGRVGHNDGLSSRYVTTSLWLWTAILIFLFLHQTTNPVGHKRHQIIGILGHVIVLVCALLSLDSFVMLWRIQDLPLWPFLGAGVFVLAIIGLYPRSDKNGKIQLKHYAQYIALFLAVIVVETSLRHGRIEAIWYQSQHLKPAVEQILASDDPLQAPDRALKTLSPEFSAEVTRQRLEVLVRHRLAAFRRIN